MYGRYTKFHPEKEQTMQYICADIHGEYELFLRLLERIGFSASDEMIICGDLIDKGRDSVRLVQYVMEHSNIRAILGNHEHAFLRRYWAMMQENPTDFDSVLWELRDYFSYDGKLLNWETVDFLEGLPPFIEEEDFICVHAGLPIEGGRVLSPKRTTTEFMVNDRRFKEPHLLPETEKCVFFGHTPTSYLCGKPRILKYRRSGVSADGVRSYCKIHLDVGTWLHGVLGCYCVETDSEIYVTKA